MHMWQINWRKKNWWLIEPVLLAIIILFGGWLRFRHLSEPAVYMFDEVYHVPTIKMIARNDPRAYEWWHKELKEETQAGAYVDWLHPPLAKLIAAVSIKIFGENSFAWRAPSALMGTLLIWLVYCLARAIFSQQKGAGLLAALITAIDGLTIAQSRIAMNDIFVTFFATAAILNYYLYLKDRNKNIYFLGTTVMTGLACASKWSGATIILFILVMELWQWLKEKKDFWLSIRNILLVCLTAAIIYLLSFFQLFQHHSWNHFVELERQVLLYQTNLKATHPYSAPAWQWPLGEKPVYFYLNSQTKEQIWNTPFYPSWYLGLTCLFLAVFWLWRRKTPKASKEKWLFLLLAYGCLWLPWCFSPRIMFLHHYLPAVTMVWVISGGVISELLTKIKSVKGAKNKSS